MFKKRPNRNTFNPNSTDTLIGEGTVIEGKLVSKAGLRIEGQVKGELESSGDITIGQNGIVQSNVTARNVYNAGLINGSVMAKEALTISNTGKIYGNITANSLSITEGGVFHGNCRMETKSEPKLINEFRSDKKEAAEHSKSAEVTKPSGMLEKINDL